MSPPPPVIACCSNVQPLVYDTASPPHTFYFIKQHESRHLGKTISRPSLPLFSYTPVLQAQHKSRPSFRYSLRGLVLDMSRNHVTVPYISDVSPMKRGETTTPETKKKKQRETTISPRSTPTPSKRMETLRVSDTMGAQPENLGLCHALRASALRRRLALRGVQRFFEKMAEGQMRIPIRRHKFQSESSKTNPGTPMRICRPESQTEDQNVDMKTRILIPIRITTR